MFTIRMTRLKQREDQIRRPKTNLADLTVAQDKGIHRPWN